MAAWRYIDYNFKSGKTIEGVHQRTGDRRWFPLVIARIGVQPSY